ncbi:molybdopterin-binding protein [Wenxinia marina]|uniref:Molybdopterin biosynthesis enzyme n=1 Tax=Wenxinia marina DSM 24838 TaxID=1123501 RepID=A0A0D0PDR9_9RHOB|nr:molybdopterin-binding protein [Wenxinia marina]KIQ69586.1 Molybdopterin biosynthesis enzyme [Wenxinia marina DSM 24838]GGL59522.1 molybdopterin biosynthesis protein [Wenxinia marina]
MRFGPVPLDEAEGAILAHSAQLPDGRLKKGAALGPDEIERLRAAGRSEVITARLEAGDVGEDEAAARIARAVAGARMEVRPAATGRVNLHAGVRGVAAIDAAAVDRLNAVHPMITLATVPEWQRLDEGAMAATVKIIAYGVPEEAVAAAEEAGRGALAMRPVQVGSARLIQTVVAGAERPGKSAAVAGRCEALGIATLDETVVPHETDALAAALAEEKTAELILILTGSATSDIADVAPAAVIAAGGTVEHFGMPVDPGNLLFVGRLDGRPVIGLPGCARSPARNGADWVLERIACGVPVGRDEITAMGVGGLLKEIPQRGRPREPKR